MLLRSACRMMAAVVLLFFAGHSLAEDKTFDDLKTFDPKEGPFFRGTKGHKK